MAVCEQLVIGADPRSKVGGFRPSHPAKRRPKYRCSRLSHPERLLDPLESVRDPLGQPVDEFVSPHLAQDLACLLVVAPLEERALTSKVVVHEPLVVHAPKATLGSPFPREAGRSFNGRGSCRGAKGGVRIDDPKQLFCIRPAVEAYAGELPSLVPLAGIISAREGRELLSNLWPSERLGERSERTGLWGS